MQPTAEEIRPTFIAANRNLSLAYLLSLLIAVLMTIASVLGLTHPQTIYPTEALRQSFFANDVINLTIGLPTLIGALWLASRGRLVGLLSWPGALMFVLYTYLAYIFSMPLRWYYLLLLTLVTLSAYTLIGLLTCLDVGAVGRHLEGAVPARLSGALLMIFGAFVFLRVFSVIANAMTDPTSVTATELAVLPADFLISPAWIIGGVQLWRRKALGYTAGPGLLFQASMLFIGLIAFMILQPLMTDAPFDLPGLLVVLGMSLVCFIPFSLYLRGIGQKE
jgi:hypothetical protein